MIKQFFVVVIITILIGCKTHQVESIQSSNQMTLSESMKIGGDYNLTSKFTQKNLTPELFAISSDELKLESNQILIFDLFSNNTNYIWHVSEISSSKFYRFISDINFENTDYQKLKTSEIKEELEMLKN